VTAIVAASRARVVVAPAMDAGMWTHPATQRNVETLRGFGYLVVEPEVGALASGLTGIGRLAEPETIVAAVERLFARAGDLDGLRVAISAGGTREPIDPVRFIGNRSSGKMGVALAEAARDRGAAVTLVAGAMSVTSPRGVNVVDATTASDMRDAVLRIAPGADILVMAAAVADYAPAKASGRKIKRGSESLRLELVPNPDIIAEVGEMPDDIRPFLVGFAAESDDLEANATGKLRDKGLDLIVANRVGGPFDAIGSEENKVVVFGVEGALTDWPMLPKRQVAERLWDLIADRFRAGREPPAPARSTRTRTRSTRRSTRQQDG
jgi:phosphopantothenoylcysteine decarboxylase/phosphopantothenate--cysteine ligase